MTTLSRAAALLAMAVPAASAAAPVTSLSYETSAIYRFDVFPTNWGAVPIGRTLAEGNSFVWESTSPMSVLDFYLDYDLGDLFGNGRWDERRHGYAGTNDPTARMSFTFDRPTQAVGGLINYYRTFRATSVMLRIFDAADVLLESVDIGATAPISTPDGTNLGAFHGFSRPTADISRFELQGSRVAIDDLAVGRLAPERQAVPLPVTLPATALSLAIALGALALIRRTRRRTPDLKIRP